MLDDQSKKIISDKLEEPLIDKQTLTSPAKKKSIIFLIQEFLEKRKVKLLIFWTILGTIYSDQVSSILSILNFFETDQHWFGIISAFMLTLNFMIRSHDIYSDMMKNWKKINMLKLKIISSFNYSIFQFLSLTSWRFL